METETIQLSLLPLIIVGQFIFFFPIMQEVLDDLNFSRWWLILLMLPALHPFGLFIYAFLYVAILIFLAILEVTIDFIKSIKKIFNSE